MSDRLAGLTPEKRVLLERLLLERRRPAAAAADTIPRRQGSGPWPLSYSQELMWLLDQLNPGSNAYNSPDATRLEGPLDVAALRRAIEAVVARNEVLRTTYDAVDGQPVQVVHPSGPVELIVVDLSGLPSEQRQAELDRYLKAESERTYDLRTDPVLRPSLLRLADEDHVLLLVLHHIAVDGWSKGVMWRELTACYDAFTARREPELPPLPVQYADWAVWHRSWLDAGVLDEQLRYWKEAMAGAPELLELPTDRTRPPVRTGLGERRDVMLDADVLDGLRRLARQENCTLFMAVLAAFGALLGRYSGQDDLVIGTPIAGRNRVEIEDVIGYFMNTVSIRVDLRGDPTFRELLSRLREVTIGAFAHQDVPFERVVSELNPQRDLSRTPLFQVMLVLQNQKRTEFAPAGLVATPVRHERGWAKFDLTVGMGERATGLNTSWEFSTDLFRPATVERMMHHFGVLLEAVLSDPDRPLSTVSLLDPAELHQLRGWESGGPAVGADVRLETLVTRRATATPGASALRCGSTTLSYAELEAESNRLARALRSLGVGAQTPVALRVERSHRLVVALLGVLKAGGACLPLDPAYPAERLRFMLADTAAPVLLTTGRTEDLDDLDPAAATVVRLEDLDLRGFEDTPLAPVGGPADAAYIIYTSGSTGRPKGVVLEHAGLANHTLAAVDLYRLRADDRMLQFSSPSFDISVEEIFATLVAGGCVVLRSAELPLGGPELVDWLEREAITVLDLPTAFWQEWVGDLTHRGLGLPASLRHVVVGGERAVPSVYAAWRRLAGDRVGWVNTYGPTEASVVATAYEPPAGWSADGGEVPIGRPLPGVTVQVLDPHLRRVPVGISGELFIGGVGLARGYLNAAGPTAERFVADPEDPRRRLYRTGDLVCWQPDGTLRYLGRGDGQIKVRGFRVEPAEIEAALAAHPAVHESAVVLRGAAGREQLVAYAVVRVGQGAEVGAELRSFLTERLPAYLVPAVVVPVASLPLTVNGKLDPARLPEPSLPTPRDDATPRDDVERRLLAIWRDMLGVDGLGVDDNFFDAGGHSLLAVRTFARVERVFGARLPLATLIAAPTVSALAEVLRDHQPSPTWSSLVPLRAGGSRTPLFLLHEPDGQVICYRHLVRRLGPDQAVYGLQSLGLDGHTQPLTRIDEMAAHYIREIRTVQPHGPYLLGGFCYGGVLAFETAHQLQRSGEEVALVALFDASPYGRSDHPGERLRDRARRRAQEFRVAPPEERLGMLPETVARTYNRLSRRYRARAVRWFTGRGRPVPRLLRDIELINHMSVQGYRTPDWHAPVALFVKDNGRGQNVERRRQLWETVTSQLDVRVIRGDRVTHLTMLAEPHVVELARDLRTAMDEALAGRR